MNAPLIGAGNNAEQLKLLSSEVALDFWFCWFDSTSALDLVSCDHEDHFSTFVNGGPL